MSPKCQLPVRKGMLFNVNLGLAGLTNPRAEEAAGKTYSLFIGDTVLVAEVRWTSLPLCQALSLSLSLSLSPLHRMVLQWS